MKNDEKITGEIVIFKTSENNVSIDVRFEGETVWLTQAQLVDLYNSSKANVSEHIKHIFEEEELDENSVVREFRTTATDGKSYNTKYYNLDMIISLGYRIKSKIATQFRQWATKHLNEYIRKGFTMDDKRTTRRRRRRPLRVRCSTSGNWACLSACRSWASACWTMGPWTI